MLLTEHPPGPEPAATPNGVTGKVCLRLRGDGDRERVVPLLAGKSTIGSSPRCTVRIVQPGVAPVHCLLVSGDGRMSVRRWASDACLNGAPFDDAVLEVGDRLTIGPAELQVEAVDENGLADGNRGRPTDDADTPDRVQDEATGTTAERGGGLQDEPASGESVSSAACGGAGLDASAAEVVFQRLRTSRSLSRERNRKFLAALKRQRQAHGELSERVEHLAREAQTALVENERLRGDLGQARQALASAEAQLGSFDDAVAHRNNMASEVERLVAERDNLAAQRDQLAAEHQQLVDERDRLTAAHDRIAAERDTLATERDGLVQERDRMVAERERQSEDAGELAAERQRLIAERDSLAAERDRLAEERDRLVGERDALAGEHRGAAEEQCRVVAENARVVAENARLAEESVRASEEIARLAAERDALAGEMDQARSERQQAVESLRRYEEKYEERQEEFARERAEWDETRDGWQSRLADHVRRIEDLQRALAQLRDDRPLPSGPAAEELAGDSADDQTHEGESVAESAEQSTDEEPLVSAVDERDHPSVLGTGAAAEWKGHDDGQTAESVADSEVCVAVADEPAAAGESHVADEAGDASEWEQAADSSEEAPEPRREWVETPSYIERYAHMFDGDADVEPVPPAAPTEPTAPRVNEPRLSESDAEHEDTIEEYMAKLLERTRGQSSADKPAPVFHTPAPEAADPQPADVADEPDEDAPLASLAEIKSSGRSEPSSNLVALRSLANDIARQAIGTCAARRYRRTAVTQIIIATLAGTTSLYLMLLAPSWHDVRFISACVSLAASAYYLYLTIATLIDSVRSSIFEELEHDLSEVDLWSPQLPIDVEQGRREGETGRQGADETR